jgi:hypothetical protein
MRVSCAVEGKILLVQVSGPVVREQLARAVSFSRPAPAHGGELLVLLDLRALP